MPRDELPAFNLGMESRPCTNSPQSRVRSIDLLGGISSNTDRVHSLKPNRNRKR